VPQEPRQATSATQPYPIGDAVVPQSVDIPPEGARVVNGGRIFTPFWDAQALVMKPSLGGGINWPPSSYDPATGYLYVCAQDSHGYFRAEDIGRDAPAGGELYVAGQLGGGSLPSLGVFAAMDMRTNRIVWRQQWTSECYSGSVTTGGGLVFVGRNDGRLTALNSATGERLWEFQTGAGMNAPPSVFEHQGRQYVVAYSAGNLFAGSAKGDSLWLFSLEGALEPVPPANRLMTFTEAAGGAADFENGLAVYETACTFCHGEDGLGGHGGGTTLADANSRGAVIQIINEGRNDMPPFGGTLTAEQIRDVSDYVIERLIQGE
jgi:alcohol dehydrogenase (cytochrome c)